MLQRPDLITEGDGELAEATPSGSGKCWPAAVFIHEARGDHDAANRLLDDVFTIESRRGHVSAGLTPLVVSMLLLRDEVAAAREPLGRRSSVRGRIDHPGQLTFGGWRILAS